MHITLTNRLSIDTVIIDLLLLVIMTKSNGRFISFRDGVLVSSIIQQMKEGSLPKLTIASATTDNLEEAFQEFEEKKQRLLRRNQQHGPIPQWPDIEQDKWYTLMAAYENLISLDDIRRLNPDLCQ